MNFSFQYIIAKNPIIIDKAKLITILMALVFPPGVDGFLYSIVEKSVKCGEVADYDVELTLAVTRPVESHLLDVVLKNTIYYGAEAEAPEHFNLIVTFFLSKDVESILTAVGVPDLS